MAGQGQHDMDTGVRSMCPWLTSLLSVDGAGSSPGAEGSEAASGTSEGKQFCSASPE